MDKEGPHPVLRVFTASAHGYPRALQEFADMIFALKMPSHPNVVRPIGVILNPSQIVMEQMQGADLVQYLNRHPGADRIGLVSPLLFIAFNR